MVVSVHPGAPGTKPAVRALAGSCDAMDLREVMRYYPQGIAVVTVNLDGERRGVTISSLVSLSLTPPRIGVSIAMSASCYEMLRDAGTFGLSVLGADQEAVARAFASSLGADAFRSAETFTRRPGGAPLLADAQSRLECRILSSLDVGDHTFFVAEPITAETGIPQGGLAYHDRRFRRLGDG